MGRKSVALLAVGFAVWVLGCSSSVERIRKADTRFRIANDAYARGNYPTAFTEAERALKIYDKHAEAHHLLGLFYMVNKPDCDRAEMHFKKAIGYHDDGSFSKAKTSLANLYINVCDRVDDAIPLLEESLDDIRYYKHSWAAEFALGRALTIKDRDDEALGHFRRALLINPNMCGAYYQIGGIHNRRGELDKAVEYFGKSTTAAPSCSGFTSGYLELGLAYEKWGKKAEAVPAFTKCAELASDTVAEGKTCRTKARALCADASVAAAADECGTLK